VTVAASATEALEVLQRVTPDVLLSDVSMPDHDGYWLIDAVRALPAELGGEIPAVALTAHGDVHGPERTLAAGFRVHLRKPLDPWELCRAVASLSRRGREPEQQSTPSGVDCRLRLSGRSTRPR